MKELIYNEQYNKNFGTEALKHVQNAVSSLMAHILNALITFCSSNILRNKTKAITCFAVKSVFANRFF